eukprot:562529-Heterocapsa_arctica.AAC.1
MQKYTKVIAVGCPTKRLSFSTNDELSGVSGSLNYTPNSPHKKVAFFGRRPRTILAGVGQFEFGRPRHRHSVPRRALIVLHKF